MPNNKQKVIFIITIYVALVVLFFISADNNWKLLTTIIFFSLIVSFFANAIKAVYKIYHYRRKKAQLPGISIEERKPRLWVLIGLSVFLSFSFLALISGQVGSLLNILLSVSFLVLLPAIIIAPSIFIAYKLFHKEKITSSINQGDKNNCISEDNNALKKSSLFYNCLVVLTIFGVFFIAYITVGLITFFLGLGVW